MGLSLPYTLFLIHPLSVFSYLVSDADKESDAKLIVDELERMSSSKGWPKLLESAGEEGSTPKADQADQGSNAPASSVVDESTDPDAKESAGDADAQKEESVAGDDTEESSTDGSQGGEDGTAEETAQQAADSARVSASFLL